MLTLAFRPLHIAVLPVWVSFVCPAMGAESGGVEIVTGLGGGAPVSILVDDQGEESSDPWIVPAVRVVSPPARVVFDGFESVQVNVDENGMNIVGDAANEPSIAVNPLNPDNIVIGWRQFDSIESDFRQSGYGYTTDGGRTWTFPGSLWPGRFGSDPVLVADGDGVFYYSAIGNNAPGVRLFKSSDGGVKWEGPIEINAAFIDKQWLAVDTTDGPGRGHLYMTWSAFDNFTRSTDGGETWPTRISAPIEMTVWGTLDVDVDGKLYLVDRGFTVAASTDAQFREQTPTFPLSVDVDMAGAPIRIGGTPNPGGILGQPWIVSDRSDGPTRGNVYLLSSLDPTGNDPYDVHFARSTDGGRTWSPPVRVNDDPPGSAWQWFGVLSIAPSGRLDAAWYDTRNGPPEQSEVYYAWSTDAGATWSKNQQVTPSFNSRIGWPRQNKIGDYTGMFSDALGAGLAYSATFNGEQDVYFLRIDIDCNENGLHDGDDIASGRSRDDDGNGVPDECEGGIECDAISRFKVACSNGGKLKARVKSNLARGTELTLDNNGDRQILTIDDAGRAKFKWRGQSGRHVVSVVECPEFSEVVDCP